MTPIIQRVNSTFSLSLNIFGNQQLDIWRKAKQPLLDTALGAKQEAYLKERSYGEAGA